MLQTRKRHAAAIMVSACAALAVACCVASAQAPPGAPGQGRGAGRGQGRGGRRLTVARVPIETLTSYLHLSPTQVSSITKIHDDLSNQMRAMRPAPGSPPDPSVFQKMGAASDAATASIEAQLNTRQKASLPGVMKELQAIQSGGIPLQVAPQLHLTSAQLSQMESISSQPMAAGQGQDRRAMFQQRRTQIEAVLTPAQKQLVDAYEAAHPRGRGGPGGRGPGGGGGRPGGAPGNGA